MAAEGARAGCAATAGRAAGGRPGWSWAGIIAPPSQPKVPECPLSDAHAPRLRLQPTGHPPCPQTTAVAGSIQQGPVPESCQTAATHDLAPPDDTAVTTHLGGCGGM